MDMKSEYMSRDVTSKLKTALPRRQAVSVMAQNLKLKALTPRGLKAMVIMYGVIGMATPAAAQADPIRGFVTSVGGELAVTLWIVGLFVAVLGYAVGRLGLLSPGNNTKAKDYGATGVKIVVGMPLLLATLLWSAQFLPYGLGEEIDAGSFFGGGSGTSDS